MKKKIYFLKLMFFILVLLLGCKKEIHEQEYANNNIVLIFDTIKANYDTLFAPYGGELIKYAPILTFKSEMVGEYLTSLMKIETDTLVLNTKSNHLLIYYRYNPMSGLNFIAKKGDTIRINEKQNTPFFTVLNRKAKEYDINYDFWKKTRYGSVYDYSTEDYYINKELCYITKGVSWKNEKKTIIKKLIEELQDEDIWLDSLYHNQLISEYEYSIYDARNKYSLLTLEIRDKDISILKSYLKEYNDSLFRNDQIGFYSNFYWICLGTYMDILTNQSFDFEQLFDSLDHIDIDLGELSSRGKITYLEQVINNYSVESAQRYYNKFIKENNDTVLINNLNRKYHYLFDEAVNNSRDIELIDRSGKRLNFESIIEKHKEKIIYVDFWASWCAPCLAEMPASKKLREKYADKKIVFVYLAINDKEDAWRKAIPIAELCDVEDNYFILNNKTSKVLEELNIRSIPKCFIYSKGKLIQQSAPRASDKQIYNILDNLLRE